MIVRARTDDDLPECERLADVVRRRDGYPPRGAHNELRAFLTSSGALASWVVENDGNLLGHVSLHESSSRQVMEIATEAAGLPVESLAIVARLLVSPDARRQGVGGSLLAVAAAEAEARGRRPVLDVVTHFEGAIRLYENQGWKRVGQVTVQIGDTEPLDEYVYLGPV